MDSKKTLHQNISIPSNETAFNLKSKKNIKISEIIGMVSDKKAKDVLRNAGTHFGTNMSHLVNALNPEYNCVR